MEYQVITKNQFAKLSINREHLDDLFLNYYSCYKFYLDRYLNEILNLEDLNKKLESLSLKRKFESNIYSEISYLNLKNVFIRNDILLDRLTEEEFNSFKDIYKEQNKEKIKNFVKATFKKLIAFNVNVASGKNVKLNNTLVIGIFAKLEDSLTKYLKEKESDFSKKLGIPVKIVIYAADSIYDIENLNLADEQKNKELLKRYPKYLPLGSVVLLQNGWKKVMIMGFCPINMDNKKEIYDYIGCLYPEGVINTNMNILFNHEDIKQIFAIGLRDEEQKKFMTSINELIGDEKQKIKILNDLK